MGNQLRWNVVFVLATIILSVGTVAVSGGHAPTAEVNGVTVTGDLATAPDLTIEPGWEPPRENLTAEEINGSFYWPDE